ncbi:MAG: hypothetical protein HRU04_10430 [Oceanospirillaceae bacterium]|nr:hypothetical protein [Oceanospirillaceae bacterium]
MISTITYNKKVYVLCLAYQALNLADIPQHIIQRGNSRQVRFLEEQDYKVCLVKLLEYSEKYKVAVHAFVLMTNHVQLASKLGKSGDFDLRNILMLETHGEKFQSHLSANTRRDFDETKKSDLMSSIEGNIKMSKKRNEPTLLAEGLLKLLQDIDAAQSIPSEGLFA